MEVLKRPVLGEILIWETEEDRNQGINWTDESEVIRNSNDLAELMDSISFNYAAIELEIKDVETNNYIATAYHCSGDGEAYFLQSHRERPLLQ